MKKINLIAALIFLIIILIQVLGVYFFQSKQATNLSYLSQKGQFAEADILGLRRYYPPQSIERYARVFYQFIPPSGKVYKGQSWLSEWQYNQLEHENKVKILFDPAKPSHNILKLELENRKGTVLSGG